MTAARVYHGATRGCGEERRVGQRRPFAHRCDRRHSRRPNRRPQAGERASRGSRRAARRRSSGSRAGSPWFGSVNPTASKSLKSPLASARPEKRPMSDASVPTTRASITIEPSTCRREPPSVRIVANSRVRCAIVIESEFAITKLPTKSAMPAKASRKPRRKVMNSIRVLGVVLGLLRGELDLGGGRQDLLDILDERRLGDTWRGGDRDLVQLALLVEDPLRRRKVEARERGAADRRDRAEPDDAGDAEALDRPVALNADRLADRRGSPCRRSPRRSRLRPAQATRPRRA